MRLWGSLLQLSEGYYLILLCEKLTKDPNWKIAILRN